jgi:tetratricopeptide (TPR) repeat protein
MRQNTGVEALLPLLLACATVAGWPPHSESGQPPRNSAPAPGGRSAQDVGSARQAYERAVALEAEGNHPAALSLLWAAAGAAPGDPDILHRLGEALQRIGALDAAIEAFERALASRPDAARAMNALVMALAAAGRGAEAVARAEAWVAAKPGDAERFFTLGLARSEQDVDAALQTLRLVIDRRPDHALAHYNVALLLKRIDRIEDAVASARRATALDGRPEAYLALASLYVQQGDFVRAEGALEAALAADRRSVEAWLMLGSVRKARGDLSRAIGAVRRAIALRPDAWGGYATLATLLARAGDEAGARQASADAEGRRSREQRERAAVVMTAVGVARLDAGQTEAARERFTAAIAAADTYAPAHYHLGRTLQRLGRLDEARLAFDRARALNPGLVSPLSSR